MDVAVLCDFTNGILWKLHVKYANLKNLLRFFINRHHQEIHRMPRVLERLQWVQRLSDWHVKPSQESGRMLGNVLLCRQAHCRWVWGVLTPSKRKSESEKDQTTSKRDQRINDIHQRKFCFYFHFSSVWMGLCGVLVSKISTRVVVDFLCRTRTRTQILVLCRYYGKGIRIWIWVSGNILCIILCSHRVWNPSPSPNLNPSPAAEMSQEIESVLSKKQKLGRGITVTFVVCTIVPRSWETAYSFSEALG